MSLPTLTSSLPAYEYAAELSRTLPDITTKMLTQTLKELEDDKLIIRKMYHEVPPKVEYSLSETGQQLMPFIEHIHQWGKNN